MTFPKNKWLLATLIWLIAGIYTLIFRETPPHRTAPPFPHFDKVAHSLLFLCQTWLAAKIWLTENQKPPYFVLFLLGFIYALSSEMAQHLFTQTRQGDIWDGIADMLGVIIALNLAHLRHTIHPNTPISNNPKEKN
ncbi:MAG: VanZ family protein [Alysiella sp.]|uniref:VanZ family protein n=1 Tax=Alysiella sp. TaxID=1872483 RepID=UPI0026DD7740|nr:VanZ family protein [Alysiella sp.]MDO4434444.1 VanZ family protein [Alysiella sp.]